MLEKHHNNHSNKRLLAVVAHPDDETFGMGGTLAFYAKQGVDVYVICATHGDAGDVEPSYLEGYDSVADLRLAELRCAVSKLGVKDVFVLPHRDSGMPGSEPNQHPEALCNTPTEQVAGEIVAYIRQIKPQVIITHDPIGNYYHPDHIATHRATEMAFLAAGDPQAYPDDQPAYAPQKLYFSSFNRRVMRLLIPIMPLFGIDPRHYGRNGDIDMEKVSRVTFPVHAAINYKNVESIREEASRCHASQGGGRRDRSAYGMLRRLFFSSRDTFAQAYPEPDDGKVSHDLFDGVNHFGE
jgi:LmbE family N-acetylglucosaminyl deacetylase